MPQSEAMLVRTFQIGSPRGRYDGLRIGAVRYLPRGVRKADYARRDLFDVWFPILAPSRKLLRTIKGKEFNSAVRKSFFDRYKKEMMANTDARQAIELLARLGERTAVSVGCYCADEHICHRSVLYTLIRQAKKGR